MTQWTIVSQVKSNRVVYYTDDADYQPPTDGDWYYCSTYRGELPKAMTLRNCWGWRFNGGVFADARQKAGLKPADRLIESNRKALLRILREKIDLIRDPHLPTCAAGELLRREKLTEATAFLAIVERDGGTAPLAGGFPFLASIAVSRGITLLEAARLVQAKARETSAAFLETEQCRERFQAAVAAAKTEEELQALRQELLDVIYPSLNAKFKYVVPNTEPMKLDAPMNEHHRVHESTRLQTQLRNAINQKRVALQSGYVGEELLRIRQASVADTYLSKGDQALKPAERSILEAYAKPRGLTTGEAARAISTAAAAADDLLAQTERTKDEILAIIASAKTMKELQRVGAELSKL